MVDVAEKWSCPHCNALWTRLDQSLADWFNRLGRVQVAHAKHCRGTELPR